MTQRISEYKLECYQKIKPLGTKGNLWMVEDSVTKTPFVMRKLPMDFQQVYQTLAAIHHTTIVEIADIFFYEGFLYVIEEYLEGQLLSDTIHTKKLSNRCVFSIGKQLFCALQVLHEHKIVHRDIKPENIMMDAHGNIKLIDFDIARLFTEGKQGDTTVKGSRDYAPPEQFGFAQSDQRTDIYSLGVTLNELATGELPEHTMCHGKLGIVVKRCTEFDPKKRYQNASQALQHMSWLEKGTTAFLFSGFFLLLLLLVSGSILLFSGRLTEYGAQTVVTPDMESEMDDLFKESTSLPVENADRIIAVTDPDLYPACLLSEYQTCEFSMHLSQNLEAAIQAKKEHAQLSLTYTMAEGNTIDFLFEDIFSEEYEQQTDNHSTDMKTFLPEYEILLDDLNKDGIVDLLITLAWRYCVHTPNPADRYYITAYSTLWVIYATEDSAPTCSVPLYFQDCTPTLQTDTLLYNYQQQEWYTFENGIWH